MEVRISRHGGDAQQSRAAVDGDALHDNADVVSDMLSSASDSADDAAEAPPVPTLSPQAAALLAALPNASTPYLTCARCNCVAFINVLRVRWRSEEKDEQRLSEFEQLPICTGCGSTKYLRAGVVSFQEKIEEERVAIKEFERKRVPATALIQRVARGFLGRLECRRRKVEHERYLRKINRSATRLQARVRGMQARRRAVLERCLRLIRAMHPSVLAFALAARPDRPPVFWYENPAERSVFFWNYREFVRRAGGRPTLIKVETNVLEITRRMLLREYVLVSRIQSRWRGITARLVFREFKRQRAWLRGIQQSPAIKVQRLFRGHTSRKQCRALRVTTQYPSQLAAYRQSRAEQAERERRKAFRAKLLGKYRLAFQVDKTTRMLTRHTQPSVGAHVLSKASSEGDIGPETRAHVHHSLRTSTSTATIPTTSQSKRRAEAANGGSERSRKIVPTDEMRGGDASGRTTSEREENEEEEEGEEQKRDWSNRSVNSRRFAQLKRTLEAKSRSRLRDPRAHIVRAQQLLATAAARK